MRDGGEDGNGNGGGWVSTFSLQSSKGGRAPPRLKKCQ